MKKSEKLLYNHMRFNASHTCPLMSTRACASQLNQKKI